MGITGRPIAGVVPAFAAFDADKLSRARQQREAHLRQLFKVGAEALLLRLDAPVLILPQMHIQLAATSNGDLMLLETLAPAVRRLSFNIFLQRGQLCRRQLAADLTFRDTPQLAVSPLHAEGNGAHLVVHTVRRIVPVHDAAVDLLRHPILHQRAADIVLIRGQVVSGQQLRFFLHIAIHIRLIKLGGKRHIQLRHAELGR